MKNRFVRVAVLAATLLLAACGKVIDTEELESQLATELQAQTGVTVTSVDCPEDVDAEQGDTFNCTATADDGSTADIKVTQTDDDGNVRWEVVGTG